MNPAIKIGVGLAAGILLLGVALYLVGSRARARLRAQNPPPGRMITVGDSRMRIECHGSGGPTVVLETGLGGPGILWQAVQEQVGQFTRVCSYDRAGLGWSEPGPTPRTAVAIARELHSLLAEAGEAGPFILVGHSSGAHNIRLFADLFPDQVAGLVFVDGAHEDQFERYPAQASPAVLWGMRRLPLLVRSGIPALFPSLIPTSLAGPLPADAQATFRALLASDPAGIQTMVDEFAAIPETLEQVRALRLRSLGELPVTVISHGAFTPMLGVEMSVEQIREGERVWLELQSELAQLSSNSRLVVAEGVGHDLPFSRPELVSEALRDMVSAIRAGEHQAFSLAHGTEQAAVQGGRLEN